MKRLTSRWQSGIANYSAGKLPDVIERLAAIEDILGDDYDLDRLRELVEADRDGRCVVLPCKKGAILHKRGQKFKADHWNISLTAFFDTNYGKILGLFNLEEAEAALKGEQE